MYDVAKANDNQPADWAPTAEQRQRAVRNTAYPPAGRIPARPGSPPLTQPA